MEPFVQNQNGKSEIPSKNKMSLLSKKYSGQFLLGTSAVMATLVAGVLLSCASPQTKNPAAGPENQNNAPNTSKESKPGERSTGPQPEGIDRAIEVVQSRSGVYLYTYAETIDPIEPRKDYLEKYRVYDQSIVQALRKLVAENREYTPNFRARCLPVWDYGLEFRDEKAAAMFLFSFRCNTIRYVEGNLFKDFTPQRTEFFKIFRYEIKPETASLIEKK